MAVKIKSPKKIKRDLVIPFDGEEQFVVPKKGGFGQPDMEDYVMVTGATRTTLGSSSAGSTNVDTTPSTVTNQPTRSTTTVLTQEPTLTSPTASGGGGGTSLPSTPTRTVSGTTQVGTGITELPTTTTPPPYTPSRLPTFPNWSSLLCSDLARQIAYFENLASTGTWSLEDASTLSTQIASGKAQYASRCVIAPTPVVPVVPVIPAPIGGGGGGGIGGGGGGEEPTDTPAPVEDKKGGISWLLIVAIIGGILLLTKKKSS